MLYQAKEKSVEFARAFRKAKDIASLETAQRLIGIEPTFAPGYASLAVLRAQAGDLDQAESLSWKALALWPCSYHLYNSLACLRISRYGSDDQMSKRLLHLSMWKLAFSEKIPESAAKYYSQALPGMDASDPETYGALAASADESLRSSPDPPEVEERLRPYILLNDLERDAISAVSQDTMTGIIDHAAECRPVLRAALRQWARETADVSEDFALMVVAMLGEIGDRDVLEELLELAGDEALFLHVHWAIHRLAQRCPSEALAVFRAASATAPLALLCGLAEHLSLLPAAFGVTDALTALLDRFREMGREDDAPHLLLTVTWALTNLGYEHRAQVLLKTFKPMLSVSGRQWLRNVQNDELGFAPKLSDLGIVGLEVEDVVIERVLMDEMDDEEEDDDFDGEEDDFEDLPFEEMPQMPMPGRNEPCWCGSGKKYKKCHLSADEEARRA